MSDDAELNDTSATVPEVYRRDPVAIAQQGITPYLVPKDTEDLKSMVSLLVKGGGVPDGYKDGGRVNVAMVATAIMAGMEIGLAPIQALASIYVVRGTPTVWGKGAKALIMRSGHLSDYRCSFVDGATIRDARIETPEQMEAVYAAGHKIIARHGEHDYEIAKPMAIPEPNVKKDEWPGGLTCFVAAGRTGVSRQFTGRFSIAQARRAQLFGKKGPWQDYPEDMMEHKAAARVWDRGFADCLKGLAIRELVEERGAVNDRPQAVGFTGVTIESPSDVTPQSEYDKLIHGLATLKTEDDFKRWKEAAEGTFDWLLSNAPDLAAKLNAAADQWTPPNVDAPKA